MRLFVMVAAFIAVGSAFAQRTTEGQARSYVMSAFITGAAPGILSDEVIITPALRAYLGLPADAPRDRIYDALSSHTAGKSLAVHPSTAAEAPLALARADGNPAFTVQAGDTNFVVVYDLGRDQVPLVTLVGETDAAPPPVASAPQPVASAPPPSAAPPSSAAPLAEAPRDAPPPPASAPAPVAVTAAPTAVQLDPILFDFESARLNAKARTRLEQALPKFAAASGTRFLVRGYADRIGSSRYNQRLSQKRAEAVRDYLVAKGLPADSIQAVCLGSTIPPTECHQKKRSALRACLAPDRRVITEIRASST
jgi:outer membrane protein OmpA-like peptidoglycan-associated protein